MRVATLSIGLFLIIYDGYYDDFLGDPENILPNSHGLIWSQLLSKNVKNFIDISVL